MSCDSSWFIPGRHTNQSDVHDVYVLQGMMILEVAVSDPYGAWPLATQKNARTTKRRAVALSAWVGICEHYLHARHPSRGEIRGDIATHVWKRTVLSCPTVPMVQNHLERNLASLYQFSEVDDWLKVLDSIFVKWVSWSQLLTEESNMVAIWTFVSIVHFYLVGVARFLCFCDRFV